jgi:hypothetical protein
MTTGVDPEPTGRLSEPGEYDQLVLVVRRGELRPGHLKAAKPRA